MVKKMKKMKKKGTGEKMKMQRTEIEKGNQEEGKGKVRTEEQT